MRRATEITRKELLASDYYHEFVEYLADLNEIDKVEDMLLGVFTPTETYRIARRLVIITLLKLGYTHRRIANILDVGLNTVARASRQIQEGRFEYF